MTPGPNDGAGLYPDGHEPCLVCGAIVAVDWDGSVICWHFMADTPSWKPREHCRGSRKGLSMAWVA